MRSFPFVTIDVFSAHVLAGNQLAVLTDARGLSNTEMQSLARETNLSETTFVFPGEKKVEQEHGIKVRIFTQVEELPFAGHPTLGTAFVLRGSSAAEKIELDLKVGKIPVRFSQRNGALFGEMTQRDPEFGNIHSRDEVAKALGLKPEDIDASLPIQTVSTGVGFAIVPVRSLATLRGAKVEWRRIAPLLAASDAKFFYLVSRETENPAARLHARMVFSQGEDPATGSAAGCAAAWMVKHGVAKPEEQVLIEQGLEIKRPSELFVRASLKDGRVSNVRVGGHAVEVMRGQLSI